MRQKAYTMCWSHFEVLIVLFLEQQQYITADFMFGMEFLFSRNFIFITNIVG